MYEDYLNFKDDEQGRKVLGVFFKVLNENKNLESISVDYLKQYLNDEDIAVFYELMSKYLNLNNATPKPIHTFTYEEITPYTILGIEDGEYTKDELLDIIAKRINFIRNHEIDKEKMQRDIDEILDAYNELTKESHKQK